jgi:hypothetical protein
MGLTARCLALAIPIVSVASCGGDVFSASEGDGGDSGTSSSGGSGSSSGSSSGSGSSGGSGSSSGSGSSGGSGSSSGGSGDGGLVPGCPGSAPSSGSPCPSAGLECEYGSNPVLGCDVVATCEQSQNVPTGWALSGPTTSGCSSVLAPGCPLTFDLVPQGSSCSSNGLTCDYPKGRCACTEGSGPVRVLVDGAIPTSWFCQVPASGCPVVRPRLGSACSPGQGSCDYGSCDIPGGTAEACDNGVWVEALEGCPLLAGVAATGH